MRKLKDSWVSGMYDARGLIFLCDKITRVRHPILFEIKTLLHEDLHHIINFFNPNRKNKRSPYDGLIDWLNRKYEKSRKI